LQIGCAPGPASKEAGLMLDSLCQVLIECSLMDWLKEKCPELSEREIASKVMNDFDGLLLGLILDVEG